MPSSCVPKARGRAPGHRATSKPIQLWCGVQISGTWAAQGQVLRCGGQEWGLTSGQPLTQTHTFFLGGEGEHKIWEVLVEYPVIQCCISVLICTNLDDIPPFLFCSSIQVVWISHLYLCHSVSLSLMYVSLLLCSIKSTFLYCTFSLFCLSPGVSHWVYFQGLWSYFLCPEVCYPGGRIKDHKFRKVPYSNDYRSKYCLQCW